jgi:iron complex outermembrane receptor protein
MNRTIPLLILAAACLPSSALAATPERSESIDPVVTVLGSRIKRTDLETAQTVVVLERQDLDRTGLVSIGELLQTLPMFGAAANTRVNFNPLASQLLRPSAGETQADLRNFGVNRTLILVDGRRWVANLAGETDLSSIPLAMVERVEILKDGASSIYGTDAIAGVVNIVTRSESNGAQATAQVGENSHGDALTEDYHFVIGANTERLSALLRVGRTEQDSVLRGDRAISESWRAGYSGRDENAGASRATPFGHFVLPDFGTPLTLANGASGIQTSDFRFYDPSQDGYNTMPERYLLVPAEQTFAHAQSDYRFTEQLHFVSSITWSETRAQTRLPPVGFEASVDATQAYNPFDTALTATYRFDRRMLTRTSDVDTLALRVGLEGVFDGLGRDVYWDVTYAHIDQERADATRNRLDSARLERSLGESFIDTNGIARCGKPGSAIDGCIPINIFGGPTGVVESMLDYVLYDAQDRYTQRSAQFAANLTATAFEFPVGNVGVALGIEHRDDRGFIEPDARTLAVAASASSPMRHLTRTRGAIQTDEAYLELNLPFNVDLPGLRALELSAATRYTDAGDAYDSVQSPRVALRWKPRHDLLVRASSSRGFRAPTIAELFTGTQIYEVLAFDPCGPSEIAQSDTLRARCRNGFQGIAPVPDDYTGEIARTEAIESGNAALAPERARTHTLGVVYSPDAVEGLDLFLNWYRIEVERTIGLRDVDFVLEECYVRANADACAGIVRNDRGELTRIAVLPLNGAGTAQIEGYDLAASYDFDTDLGRFRVGASGTYTAKYLEANRTEGRTENGSMGRDPTLGVGNGVGIYLPGDPRWRVRGQVNVDWTYRDYAVALTARYFSALDEDCSAVALISDAARQASCDRPEGSPQFPFAEHRIDAAWYLDAQFSWNTPWDSQITVGVRNLLDRTPPVSYAAPESGFDYQYDLPGRQWHVRYRQNL